MRRYSTTIAKGRSGRIVLLLLVLLSPSFALSVNGAGSGDGDGVPNSVFTLDGDLTTQEIILASSTITGSKHDFTFNASLTPKGECSACHNVRVGEPFLWTRSLTEEEAYFNQTSNPNYVVSPTIYCYDCHDNHETVDNDPDYRYFISESLGRYIPQDVAFDGNMTGNTLSYDSSPADNESGYYETIPPNTAPPIDGSSTAGHYIKSDPAGLTNINQGDKLPCTDCHEPHNSEPTNEVFLRGSAWFPLGGKTVSNLKASNKTRSGTGSGRAICTNCHGSSDAGQSVRFVDITPDYGSTERIVQTPSGVSAHASTDNSSCSPCHRHDAPVHGDGTTGAGCEECHGHDAGYGVTGGAGTYFSHSTHTEDDSDDLKGPNINCSDCHDTSSYPNFADSATALAATTVCDSCHSPNGSFDGVQMAKTNWDSGVYSGSALPAGKETWCASCHDGEPAYSRRTIPMAPIVIDNPNATVSPDGDWSTYAGSAPTYGDDCRYKEEGNGSATVTWTPDIPVEGNYTVYAWWIEGSQRATNAPYTVHYNGGSETVRVNQNESESGGSWHELGTYNFLAGTSGYVVLSDNPDANGTVVADAIKLERASIIVDNPDATVYPEGNWSAYASSAPTYGDDCRYKEGGNGSATVTWTPDIPEDGDYNLYAWWIEGSQRAINAPYTIHYNGGSETVRINQNKPGSGGKWNYVGTYNFLAGTSGYVVLSDGPDAYGTVVADAIKLESSDIPIPGVYAPNVVGDNATYGFYATGHGAHGWVECLECHNARTEHIDHEHRTYASASNNYQAGYRLAKPLVVPRPYRGTPVNDNLYAHLDDFALCGDCHNLYEVLGEDIEDYDASHTNFVKSDRTRNSHKYHINFGGLYCDSDWDWVSLDSAVTCIQCHNVHGPPNQAMMRHGELMSTYGTADKVPGMQFSYLTSLSPKVYDTEADVKDSVGSNITWEDNHFATNGFCTASCHGSKLVIRAPYLGPKVLTNKAYPNNVPADGATEVLITALVADHNDNVPSDGVAINLSTIDGGVETMYDDGINGGDLTAGDNIYSYTTTVPDTVASGFKSIQVTATDPDGEGACSITLHVQGLGEIVLDNTEATYVGTWPSYTHSELYEGGGQYHEAGSGANTATWTPLIIEAGYYNVYAWWHSNPTCRASDAPYTINYDGGSETIDINQSRYGGVWVLLGTYPFAVGNSGSVVLSDDADDYVIADAIKLEREDPSEIIRDDINADYVGTWPSYKNPEPYGGEAQYHEAGTGANTATWTFTIRTPGNYNVYAWWHAHQNRATNAPYTITYEGDSATVEVCQEIRGGRWNYLGNYPFNAGDYSVVLSDDADEYLNADAIKFEQGSAPAHPYPIADNWDAIFVGHWHGSTWQDGGVTNGPDFQYHEAGTGANTATWTIAVPSAGNYNVYAWWSAHENRAANAPYTINYEGDSATVEVCQEIRGGRWNYLGNYPFNAGDYSVVLSDDADEYLNADAIKFEQGSAPAHPYPIADNWDATFVGPWHGSTWQDGGATYGPDYQHKLGSGGNNNSVTWTTDIPTAGTYSVYTRWSEHDNRPTNAPYTVYYQGGSQEVTVDQTTDGGKWMYLGSYNFSADTYSVVLYDNVPTDKRLVADAVKWEKGLVVDNVDATFSGTWNTSSWAPGYFGTNYHYHEAGNGTDTATWTPNILTTDTYSVYAWWSAYTNRATNASYTVNYDGGSETIEKNQTQDGGQWNLLGIYPFAEGTSGSVVLSDKADGFVIADALRFERVKNNSWLTPTAIHCSNLSNASALIDNSTATGNTLDSGTEQYVVFDLGTNYTVPSIKLYTDGNSYTWNVSMGNDTSNPSCCNHSDWGTLVIEDWQTTSAGWTETELTTPATARYIKLTRSDGSGDLNASSLFEFMFDPPAATLTYELHSYADLHIYDPAGRHVGMNYATGELENHIPGAVCCFSEVQTVSLQKLAVGKYKAFLKGTGTGGYELTVTGESESETIASETFSANITEGEIHDATTEVNTAEVTKITITVDEPLEPTVQTVGVANVTLAGLYPAIDNVVVEKSTLEAVDTTSMPKSIVDVHSTFMINATGSGNFVIRFDDIEHAEEITAVYKVVQNGSWIPLPFTVKCSTIEVTLEAGDPPVVFASAMQLEPTPTPTITPTPPPASGGGGGGGMVSYLYPTPTPTSMTDEGDSASSKPKANFHFMSPGVSSTPTATITTTPLATHKPGPGEMVPGFEAFVALFALLAIACLLLRREKHC